MPFLLNKSLFSTVLSSKVGGSGVELKPDLCQVSANMKGGMKTMALLEERSRDFYLLRLSEVVNELRGVGILGYTGGKRWWYGGNFALKEGDEDVILLAGGLGAIDSAYLEVAQLLHDATGLGVVFAPVAKNPLNWNIGPAQAARALLYECVVHVLRLQGVKRVFGVGHSWGGILLMIFKRMLDEHCLAEISLPHVWTVGSPVNNTPWRLLQLLAELLIVANRPTLDIPRGLFQIADEMMRGLSPRLLPEDLLAMQEELEDRGDEFTTVALPRDRDPIAPHDRCHTRNARNVVLKESPSAHLTHTGMVLHPRTLEIVSAEILEFVAHEEERIKIAQTT